MKVTCQVFLRDEQDCASTKLSRSHILKLDRKAKFAKALKESTICSDIST